MAKRKDPVEFQAFNLVDLNGITYKDVKRLEKLSKDAEVLLKELLPLIETKTLLPSEYCLYVRAMKALGLPYKERRKK